MRGLCTRSAFALLLLRLQPSADFSPCAFGRAGVLLMPVHRLLFYAVKGRRVLCLGVPYSQRYYFTVVAPHVETVVLRFYAVVLNLIFFK